MPTLSEILAKSEAALSAARERHDALTPAEKADAFISGQWSMARKFVALAREKRDWRRKLGAVDPIALQFYCDEVPALIASAMRHRRSALRAAAQFRQLRAAQAAVQAKAA